MNSGSLWKKSNLGSGAFGGVTLFTNIQTNEQLVVKKAHDENMTERMKERWKLECQKMIELSHINIVKGLQLPDSLKHINTAPCPVLTMEYCNMQDLRKKIAKSVNIYGLEEYQVKMIANDVTQAVVYLHANNIFHRDLKPENIVLNKLPGERIVYKVTDLGYAKEISDTSSCYSIVGTLQYLAPELLTDKSYSGRVDYWSLATTLFECTTGFRPFAPTAYKDNLKEVILLKQDEDIYVFQDGDYLKFHQSLPTPSRISSATKEKLEGWFRLMLRFDPAERGGKIDPTNQTFECFNLLNDILYMKIITVFKPQTLQSTTYDLSNHHQAKLFDDQLISIHGPNEYSFMIDNDGKVVMGDFDNYSYCLDYGLNKSTETSELYWFGSSDAAHSHDIPTRSNMFIEALKSNSMDKLDTLGKQMKCSLFLSYHAYEQLKNATKLFEAVKALSLYYEDRKDVVKELRKEVLGVRALKDYVINGITLDIENLRILEERGLNTELREFEERKSGFIEKNTFEEINHALEKCSELENLIHCFPIQDILHSNNPSVQKNFQDAVDLEKTLKQTPHNMIEKTDARPKLSDCLRECDEVYEGVATLCADFMNTVLVHSNTCSIASHRIAELKRGYNDWQRDSKHTMLSLINTENNNNNNNNNNNVVGGGCSSTKELCRQSMEMIKKVEMMLELQAEKNGHS